MRKLNLLSSVMFGVAAFLPITVYAQSSLPFGIGASSKNAEQESSAKKPSEPEETRRSSGSALPFGIGQSSRNEEEEDEIDWGYDKPDSRLTVKKTPSVSTRAVVPAEVEPYVPPKIEPVEIDFQASELSLKRVGRGSTAVITAFGGCAQVQNLSMEGDLMIPHRTQREWQSFITYAPQSPTINVSGCCNMQELLQCGANMSVTVRSGPRKNETYAATRELITLNVPRGYAKQYRCTDTGWEAQGRGRDICQ